MITPETNTALSAADAATVSVSVVKADTNTKAEPDLHAPEAETPAENEQPPSLKDTTAYEVRFLRNDLKKRVRGSTAAGSFVWNLWFDFPLLQSKKKRGSPQLYGEITFMDDAGGSVLEFLQQLAVDDNEVVLAVREDYATGFTWMLSDFSIVHPSSLKDYAPEFPIQFSSNDQFIDVDSPRTLVIRFTYSAVSAVRNDSL